MPEIAVHVLTLGGTIAMVPGGGDPALDAPALLASVPALGTVAQITAATAERLPGASLEFSHLLEALDQARTAVRRGAAGVVISQGTDTLEETAYFWDLLWDLPEPLVVTGAMRLAGTPGADGPGNLMSAAVVAAAAASRDRGVLVAFGDEVHAARRVGKVHSVRLGAFSSPETGPVGRVQEGEVVYWAAPPPARDPLSVRSVPAPSVSLVPVVLGDDGRALTAVAADSAGVVLATMGAGHVPARMLDRIAETVTALPVALCSRTGAGPVLHHTYGFPGAEPDLHRLGLLDSGDLSPLKARILLTVALWSAAERPVQETAYLRHALP